MQVVPFLSNLFAISKT